jgi:hypothetical protein
MKKSIVLPWWSGWVVYAAVILLVGVAHAQSTINNQPYPVHVAEHVQRASQHDIAHEQSLFNNGGVTTASGERKASDFSAKFDEISLGEAAREIRKRESKKTILDK